MEKILTKDEIYVRDELTKVYPQLVINMKKTCGYNSNIWADDLLALCVTFFLEKPIETQLKVIADGKLENYITFIAGMQVKSGSSKFYTTYRRFLYNTRELYVNYAYNQQRVTYEQPFDDEESPQLRCIKYHMEKLNPYEKMIIQKKVIDDFTFKDISKEYNIPYTTLAADTKKTLNKLKELCQPQ